MAKPKSSRNRRGRRSDAKGLETTVYGAVLQQIRQHARSTPNAEICGVLIGSRQHRATEVIGTIEGHQANQGEAHVTFTQETWVKIHEEKQERFPDDAIVGWYHSHPGFGVFLSDHDLFIHENFFSEPGQLAWVYDPHTDEEGCFGWEDGDVRRVKRLAVVYDGESAPTIRSEPSPTERDLLEAPRSRGTAHSWRSLGRDLWLLGAGAVIGISLAIALLFLLFRPRVITVQPPKDEQGISIHWSDRTPSRRPTPASTANDQGAPHAPDTNTPSPPGGRHGQPSD